jgi:hypothetical protein
MCVADRVLISVSLDYAVFVSVNWLSPGKSRELENPAGNLNLENILRMTCQKEEEWLFQTR